MGNCDQDLLEFLSSIDIGDGEWKGKVEKYITENFTKNDSKSKRVPLFSIGEDQEDECTSHIAETKEIGIQCQRDGDNNNYDYLKNGGERDFQDIQNDWKKGSQITGGEALRLLKVDQTAKHRDLERKFVNEEAIAIRREFLSHKGKELKELPFKGYDYKYVVDSCCENVIGYVPVPVGIAGPLVLNGKSDVYVPMATTEGALVASTNRGMSAIKKATGGVRTSVYESGMTRAPVVRFQTAHGAVELKKWLGESSNFRRVKERFEYDSRFARLINIDVSIDGNLAFVRFVASTGDAMGMNMVSKGCSHAMRYITSQFPDMTMISLSGNYCVDKKPAALNWTQGRGRSVVADCVLPSSAVQSILKTTPKDMASACNAKMQIGSARAACVGGSNAQAANIVAAVFIATGQDAAQVVSSSMCSTRMEETDEGDLYVSVTMPCVEVGTIGGGTILPPQKSCLQTLNCAGSAVVPGENAERLAQVVAATVLAGEISLMAALVTDDLVASHMKLNRSKLQLYSDGASSKRQVSEIDKDIEKAKASGSSRSVNNIKLKRIPQEIVQCSNIL